MTRSSLSCAQERDRENDKGKEKESRKGEEGRKGERPLSVWERGRKRGGRKGKREKEERERYGNYLRNNNILIREEREEIGREGEREREGLRGTDRYKGKSENRCGERENLTRRRKEKKERTKKLEVEVTKR